MRELLTSRLTQPNLAQEPNAAARILNLEGRLETGAKQSLIPAAALVPLIDHPKGMTILLTERTRHLHDHAGQISFPGGRVEPHDESATATALRETEEEIGLAPDFIEIVGYLDLYATGTGFLVTPVVGLVSPGFNLAPDKIEVADVFEVPLEYVLNPRNHRRETRAIRGVQRSFYVIEYQDRYIWGATAGMLVNLYEKISGK